MKTTNYVKVVDKHKQAKIQYENMLVTLQKDIRNNCALKVGAICKELDIKTAMYRYYFRSKNWPEKLLKKLLKIAGRF